MCEALCTEVYHTNKRYIHSNCIMRTALRGLSLQIEDAPAEKPMALRIQTRCCPHSVSSTLLVSNTRDSDVRIFAICGASWRT